MTSNPRVVYLKAEGKLVGALAYQEQPDGVTVKVALSALADEDRKGVWVDLPPRTEGPAAGKPRRKRVFNKRVTADIAISKLEASPLLVPILKGSSLLDIHLAVFVNLAHKAGAVNRGLMPKKRYEGYKYSVADRLQEAILDHVNELRMRIADRNSRPTTETLTWNLSLPLSSSAQHSSSVVS